MKRAERDRIRGLRMPRSRGAVSGLLLVILGAWGALIPFVGPHFNFAYTPDQEWAWTTARGWLEVLPGAATVAGGLLLIVSRNRATAMFGGWLAVLAGAWFVIGGQVAPLLGIGAIGDPVAATDRKRALLEISYFSGLGALIIFLGAAALARTAARLARDVVPFEAPVEPAAPLASEPVHEPYRYTDMPPADAPSGAVTAPAPRAQQLLPAEREPSHRGNGFRLHREREAAYTRWPQPQPQ
ncbi:MAG: hypothetical protein WCB92_09955 [Mycobacterium sp.]